MRAASMVDSEAWSPTTASTGSAGSMRLMTKVTTSRPSRVVATERTRRRTAFILQHVKEPA